MSIPTEETSSGKDPSSQARNSSLQVMLYQLAVMQATDLARAGYFPKAEKCLDELGLDQKTQPVLDLLARIRAQQGRLPEAALLWTQLLKIDPENLKAQKGLSRAQITRLRATGIAALPWLIIGGTILIMLLLGRALLTSYATNQSAALSSTALQISGEPSATMTPVVLVSTVVQTVIVAATPAPMATLPTQPPLVVVVTATPVPRQQILRLDQSPRYQVKQILCDQSNPNVWHHGPFTVEGTVYAPPFLNSNNQLQTWVSHIKVVGAKSLTGPIRISNETEQWIARLYILPLYENGGPGFWYIWIVQNDQRTSEVGMVTVDLDCPHAVIDFENVGVR